MRTGILGGTFDPPHTGHLLVALDAAEALGLDRLVLVPAASQPLKVGTVAAGADDRLAMTRLLAGDEPGLGVDPIEIQRAGLSYTVDTLATFAERGPDDERYFLVGADVLASFARWREPERVLALARLVVLRRGAEAPEPLAVPRGVAAPLYLPTRRVDVSSTEVRARVRAGKTIRGFVPDPVADYIRAAGLYR